MALILALHLLSVISAWALTAGDLEASGAPAIFLKTESFDLPSGARDPEIIYGNAEIGYFVQRKPAIKGGRLQLTLIPPTYRKPVEFELRYTSQSGAKVTRKVGSKKYKSPDPGIYQTAPRLHGRFSFPFFLVNGTVAASNGNPRFFPLIMNSLGEVVWYAFGGGNNAMKAIMMQALGQGRYMFLKRQLETDLKQLTFSGEVERDIDFRKKGFPVNSHGFKYFPESGELLYIGYDCRALPWYKEFAPLFSFPAGWWRLLRLPRRSYLGGRLIKLNMNTGDLKVLWRSYDDFAPNKYPNLDYGDDYATDRFMDVRTSQQYLRALRDNRVHGDWDKACSVDWTHENSVDFRPDEGYLVSIRNLNQIVLIKPDGKLAWKMGEDARSDIVLPAGEGFSMQHSASFLPNGDILIFDNNTPFRGYTGKRSRTRLMIVEKPVKGQEPKGKTIELDAPQTDIRGSAARLLNDRYFAYVPGRPGTREVVIETDADRRHASRLEFGGEFAGRGIEAKPLYAIGTEEFLEDRSKVIEAPASDNLSPSHLIDNTY